MNHSKLFIISLLFFFEISPFQHMEIPDFKAIVRSEVREAIHAEKEYNFIKKCVLYGAAVTAVVLLWKKYGWAGNEFISTQLNRFEGVEAQLTDEQNEARDAYNQVTVTLTTQAASIDQCNQSMESLNKQMQGRREIYLKLLVEIKQRQEAIEAEVKQDEAKLRQKEDEFKKNYNELIELFNQFSHATETNRAQSKDLMNNLLQLSSFVSMLNPSLKASKDSIGFNVMQVSLLTEQAKVFKQLGKIDEYNRVIDMLSQLNHQSHNSVGQMIAAPNAKTEKPKKTRNLVERVKHMQKTITPVNFKTLDWH